jgi:hypothetical protein
MSARKSAGLPKLSMAYWYGLVVKNSVAAEMRPA